MTRYPAQKSARAQIKNRGCYRHPRLKPAQAGFEPATL
ncbi:hypothetical protein LRHMDP2_670 [Lacticaseibacillus rhamnosus LRHMDP2]|uniref:Uncharacterized protein n=1 Tax=Lacticaseibacillus rhamnosus LRHMDP3 TaxID=1203259 RepID=A0AB33XU68_LACRH|nr:hypothetical protein LRHMDP3_1548 [Lacticaseibacillus rhamnosus LRHMDP3]EKS53419.1 hypothetical protein LRHMDP2_670 [Lacticaseibacillus rhamnosus LRHMDP2]